MERNLVAKNHRVTRKSLFVLRRLGLLALLFAEQELRVNHINCCLRVLGKAAVSPQVSLRGNSLAQLPALPLIDAHHRCKLLCRERRVPVEKRIERRLLALAARSEKPRSRLRWH